MNAVRLAERKSSGFALPHICVDATLTARLRGSTAPLLRYGTYFEEREKLAFAVTINGGFYGLF